MQIKKEFKDLIPPLSQEEFKQLEENCLKEGIRDAIVTWQGFIIDGHNRYEISQRHGLKYQTIEKAFESENDVIEWMIRNQFGRRNLNNYQRSILALQLEDVFKIKAKENQGYRNDICQNSDKSTIDSKKELAKIADVSHDTIMRVKAIEAKAPEEVKEKLRTGDISINQAFTEIKKEEKKEQKKQEIEAIKLKANDFIESDIHIYNMDFREYEFTEKVDLILTDPPYPEEFLPLWRDLFFKAKEILKPNGFLIAYSGQMYLDKIFKYANESGLDYYWIMNIEFTKKPLVHGRKVLNEWKPILIFQNGFKQHDRVFSDKINMSYSEREMHDLNWGQTVEPFEFLLDRFSNEMDLVFEPFAGTGTTLLACKNKKRRCIGTEIETNYIDLIKGRLQ